MTVDEWLEANVSEGGEAVRSAMRRVISNVESRGGEAYVTDKKTQVGLRLPATTEAGSVVALEIKPDPASICLPLGWLQSASPFDDELARGNVHADLTSIVGELSSDNLRGFANFPADRLVDDETAEKFDRFLAKLSGVLASGELPAEKTSEAIAIEPKTVALSMFEDADPSPKRKLVKSGMLVALGTLALRALGRR